MARGVDPETMGLLTDQSSPLPSTRMRSRSAIQVSQNITRLWLLFATVAFFFARTARADELTVRALEGGSWQQSVTAAETDPRSEGRTIHIVVEDRGSHRRACGEYDLSFDVVGAAAFQIGRCDPHTNATELLLVHRAALFASGDIVPRPLPVSIRATVALNASSLSTPPSLQGGTEIRCSVAVRPYVTDLLHGATVYLDPAQYSIRVANSRVQAVDSSPGWSLTATASRRASLSVEYDILRKSDHQIVLHDRTTLQCSTGTASPIDETDVRRSTSSAEEVQNIPPNPYDSLPDVCRSATVLSSGSVVTGDLREHSTLWPGPEESGPGEIFRIHVEQESFVAIHLVPDFEAAMALFEGCGHDAPRIAEVGPTSVLAPDAPRVITTRLPRGDYQLKFVSPPNPDRGGFSLSVSVLPVVDDERSVSASRIRAEQLVCARAPLITVGNPIRGVLHAGTGVFSPYSCSEGQGSEVVYSLHLAERRHVEIATRSDFAATVYVRAACSDRANDLVCATSDPIQRTTDVESDLAAGDYEIVVDGSTPQSEGSYLITVNTSGESEM